jgi:hypothetical protein
MSVLITNTTMGQQEYNNWWFDHYCEMGVSGFPDPRDNDNDFYDIWKEQQERQFDERFNSYFENTF